jgi:protein-L-isoaspartate(D-aspartate) O-methyltransferase
MTRRTITGDLLQDNDGPAGARYHPFMSETLADLLLAQGIRDGRVLDAVGCIPRRLFVPTDLAWAAEDDRPLPIGHGQTISQPFVVAAMTEQLHLQGTEVVLEIGTGSGYQTALLSVLAREVWSVEIVPELAEQARTVLLETLGLQNVHLRCGDGALGWPEAAPFDRIIVTAAAAAVPPELVAQLRPGGRLILPLGPVRQIQTLRVVDKAADGRISEVDLFGVRFVPLVRSV